MNNSPTADTVEIPALENPLAKHFGPSPPPVSVKFGAVSHPGRVRANNEDHFMVVERRRSRKLLLSNLPEGFLLPSDDVGYVMGVADGMGGAAFGELASMLRSAAAGSNGPPPSSGPGSSMTVKSKNSRSEWKSSFAAWTRPCWLGHARNRRAREWEPRLPELTPSARKRSSPTSGIRGLICTMPANSLELTRDHTLAQDYIDRGFPVLARSWHHKLTNCLGGDDREIYVDFHHFHLDDGDQLLLCTDGLTDLVRDEEIAAFLSPAADPQAAAQALVNLALDRGGKDNVTVIVAQYTLIVK